MSSLSCTDEARRRKVRGAGRNGIDAIEVGPDQLTLTVSLFGKAPAGDIGIANVRIDGGRRITGIQVTGVTVRRVADPEAPDTIEVTVDRPGDFSPYTLRLVRPDAAGRAGTEPLEGSDPRYAAAEFSFKVSCPTDLDCATVADCPPVILPEPEIPYLAKDYASFRQLLLDRLALIMPGWTERHVPDLGVTLVELLAYVGDYLSYYQDAVATEAYLDTARKRISVRRHVRLVDYLMHDGCNARAWVCVDVAEDAQPLSLPAGKVFFISGAGALAADDLCTLPASSYQVYEPLTPVTLYPNHNQICFWTWGDEQCCLNRGATSATLKGPLQLKVGDVLLVEEICGPRTGVAADADPTHRQAVRLTSVTPGTDDLYTQPIVEITWAAEDALTFPLCLSAVVGDNCALEDISVARGNVILVDHGCTLGGPGEELHVPSATPQPAGCVGPGEPRDPILVQPPYDLTLKQRPVTQRAPYPPVGVVARAQATRLVQIPTQVQDRLDTLWQQAAAGQPLEDSQVTEIETVFGERALAEARWPAQPDAAEQARALGWLLARASRLLAAKLRWLRGLARHARAGVELSSDQIVEITEAFGPYTAGLDVTTGAGPARDALIQDPRDALPAITLLAIDPAGGQHPWTARRDLLSSGPDAPDFVAETDDDGITHLRFGDGALGRAPAPDTAFRACYRVGSGTAGNVGAEAINRIAGPVPAGIKVRNPLAAVGGVDPEPVADVRRLAPDAFRHRLARAVTADDYATLAGALPGLQRAAASLRWTGSWYEAQVAIDPLGTETADETLLEGVYEGLHRYRRIGHDLLVTPASYIPLDLALSVCVAPHYLRADVKAALLDALSDRVLPGGRLGFFHPDNLTFGQDIEISQLLALAAAIPGVAEVQVTTLSRLGQPDAGELKAGVLRIGPLEIAQLDNDPDFPEHGRLQLTLAGGR